MFFFRKGERRINQHFEIREVNFCKEPKSEKNWGRGGGGGGGGGGERGGRQGGWWSRVLKPKQYARLSNEVQKSNHLHNVEHVVQTIFQNMLIISLSKIPTILILSSLVSEFRQGIQI